MRPRERERERIFEEVMAMQLSNLIRNIHSTVQELNESQTEDKPNIIVVHHGQIVENQE